MPELVRCCDKTSLNDEQKKGFQTHFIYLLLRSKDNQQIYERYQHNLSPLISKSRRDNCFFNSMSSCISMLLLNYVTM